MKSGKRILSLLMALMMLLGMAQTFAMAEEAAAPVISFTAQLEEGKTLKPGDTFNVLVSIKNNPGFAAWQGKIDYDTTALTWESFTHTGYKMADGTPFPVVNTEKNKMVYANMNDITGDGDLCVLGFSVKEDAPAGSYSINYKAESNDDVLSNVNDSVISNVSYQAASVTVAQESAPSQAKIVCGIPTSKKDADGKQIYEYQELGDTLILNNIVGSGTGPWVKSATLFVVDGSDVLTDTTWQIAENDLAVRFSGVNTPPEGGALIEVYGSKTGTTSVTATLASGETKTLNLKVVRYAGKIIYSQMPSGSRYSSSNKYLTVSDGETLTPAYTLRSFGNLLTEEELKDNVVEWRSDDSTVASVENGTYTFHTGVTKIYAVVKGSINGRDYDMKGDEITVYAGNQYPQELSFKDEKEQIVPVDYETNNALGTPSKYAKISVGVGESRTLELVGNPIESSANIAATKATSADTNSAKVSLSDNTITVTGVAASNSPVKLNVSWTKTLGDNDYSIGTTLYVDVAAHTNRENSYARVEGTQTHTVTVSCKDCGGQVGEPTVENCVDADGNALCDLCGGAVEISYSIAAKKANVGVAYENGKIIDLSELVTVEPANAQINWAYNLDTIEGLDSELVLANQSSMQSGSTLADGKLTLKDGAQNSAILLKGTLAADSSKTVELHIFAVAPSFANSEVELSEIEKQNVSVSDSQSSMAQHFGYVYDWEWTSDNTAAVTVSADGTATPVATGEANITATDKNSGASASYKAKVPVPTVAVTQVNISAQTLTLTVDETETLTAQVLPENATDKSITWSSDNENVATVENGLVTAVGAGSATITATASNNVSASCAVTVNPKGEVLSGLTAALSGTQSVEAGETAEVKLFVESNQEESYNAFEFALTYDAEKLRYAGSSFEGHKSHSVTDDGAGNLIVYGYGDAIAASAETQLVTLKFTANAKGDAQVKLTDAYANDSAFATEEDLKQISISEERNAATISVNETYSIKFVGGSVNDGKTELSYSSAIGSVSFTVDAKTGHDSFEVSADNGNLVKNDDGSYTLSGVTADTTVSIDYAANRYNVSFSGNGAADASGASTATYGQAYSFTMNEQAGFTYSYSATVGGNSVSLNGTTIAAKDVTGDIVITITKNQTAVENTYAVQVYKNGQRSTGDDQTVAQNASSYAFDYDTSAWKLLKVEVAGAQVQVSDTNGAVTVTGPITGNISIYYGGVYSVTVPDGANGEEKANYGDDYSFTVDDNHELDKVSVNGEDITVEPTDGTYVIPADQITGDIVITVKAKNYEVEVYEYVKTDGKAAMLIVAKSSKLDGKLLSYDGQNMYWSAEYQGYAFLVMTETTVTAEEAAAKVAMAEGSAVEIAYTGDVNMTAKVDMNDAQLAYDIYNVKYQSFTEVSMEKFLRADVNKDHKVDTLDTAAIVASVRG